MKKFFYLLSMVVASVATIMFTSCSNEETVTFPIDEELAGNYKGTIIANLLVDGAEPMPVGEEIQNIAVVKAGDNAISLSIKNFSFLDGLVNIPEISLNNCELLKNGDAYGFEGSTSVNVPELPLTGTVNAEGTFQNGKLHLDLDIPDANFMGLSQHVSVTYDGDRLKGTESKEAIITKFTFNVEDAEANAIVIGTPFIDEENHNIFFYVDETKLAENPDWIKVLVPTIEYSSGATISQESGVATNFESEQIYKVVSEDGSATSIYKVKAVRTSGGTFGLKFSFEEWKEPVTTDKNHTLLPKEVWASSADGAGFLPGAIILQREDIGVKGFAARMKTFEYGDPGNELIPKITSGSIYIGKFDIMSALPPKNDRLSSTKFGLPTSQLGMLGKPVTFKGNYKYVSGEKYIDGEEDPAGEHPIEGKKDECAIQAVLYEAKDTEGNDVTLTGHDINTSEYIVAMASLADGTEKSEFTSFEIPFEYRKAYDASKEYKFAIVCSSSKNGDTFKGAGGSTLTVDEFEVICE